MLRFGNSDAALHRAMAELVRHWDSSASSWRDEARREFGKEYIDALEPSVKAACAAMKNVYAFLRKVREECG